MATRGLGTKSTSCSTCNFMHVKGVTSLGPHTRPACHQAPLEMLIKKLTIRTCVCNARELRADWLKWVT